MDSPRFGPTFLCPSPRSSKTPHLCSSGRLFDACLCSPPPTPGLPVNFLSLPHATSRPPSSTTRPAGGSRPWTTIINSRVLEVECSPRGIELNNRFMSLGVYPIGIDPDHVAKTLRKPWVQNRIKEVRACVSVLVAVAITFLGCWQFAVVATIISCIMPLLLLLSLIVSPMVLPNLPVLISLPSCLRASSYRAYRALCSKVKNCRRNRRRFETIICSSRGGSIDCV